MFVEFEVVLDSCAALLALGLLKISASVLGHEFVGVEIALLVVVCLLIDELEFWLVFILCSVH